MNQLFGGLQGGSPTGTFFDLFLRLWNTISCILRAVSQKNLKIIFTADFSRSNLINHTITSPQKNKAKTKKKQQKQKPKKLTVVNTAGTCVPIAL